MKIDPFDDKRLYISYQDTRSIATGAFLISEDGGKTFKDSGVTETVRPTHVHCDANHEGVVLLDGRDANEMFIFMSRDHGKKWKRIHSPKLDNYRMLLWHSLDPDDDQLLYVATSSSRNTDIEFWYTYYDGKTWELYFTDKGGAKMSEDVEKKLNSIFPKVMVGVKSGTFQYYLYIDPSNPKVFYRYSVYDGMLRTTDGGESWTEISKGLVWATLEQIIPHPTNAQVALCRDDHRSFLTTDLGKHWKCVAPENGKSFEVLAFHPLKENTIFAGTSNSLWRSDDMGEKWGQVKVNLAGELKAVMFSDSDPETYYLVLTNAIMTTKDNGNTWTTKNVPEVDMKNTVLTTTSGTPVAVNFAKGSVTILSAEGDHKVLKMETQYPGDKAVCPDDGSLIAFSDSNTFYLTLDEGKNWHRYGRGSYIDGQSIPAFAPKDCNTLLIAQHYRGLYVVDLKTGEMKLVARYPGWNRPSSLAVSPDGKFAWAGLDNEGVWTVNLDIEPPEKEEE